MAEPYLGDLSALAARLAPGEAIACKHFFSGAAAYADGRIFMSWTPAGLALKLPEARRAALLEQGGRPLRYFPKAPVKRGYVLLPARLLSDEAALAGLISESLHHVRSGASAP